MHLAVCDAWAKVRAVPTLHCLIDCMAAQPQPATASPRLDRDLVELGQTADDSASAQAIKAIDALLGLGRQARRISYLLRNSHIAKVRYGCMTKPSATSGIVRSHLNESHKGTSNAFA
jgi:hypothetical protein